MSALRKLAVCYLVSASAFGLAAGLRAWPQGTDAAARLFESKVRQPFAAALTDAMRAWDADGQSDARVVLALEAPSTALPPPGPADGRTFAHVELPKIERPSLIDQAPQEAPQVELTLAEPILIAPDLAPAPQRERRAKPSASVTPPPRDEPVRRAEAAPLPEQALTPEQLRARARLAAALTSDMRENFGLFIFVSKAVRGPLAQRAYVFRKEHGDLKLLYDWAASTGREQQEHNARGNPSFTATPAGFYQFDPDRMYRQYHSGSWDQDMPHAMFFNWRRDGLQTGLAIHAATGDDVARLGARASAGCVHLSPENARTLFELVKRDYRGAVPRFAVDGNDTMSNKGKFARKADGGLKMAEGYRVLIDIENYGGVDGADAVALF